MNENGLESINMIWVGDKISNCERMCMQSFLKNGHHIKLWTYGKVENVPDGIEYMDANEIVPKNKIFKHQNSYAPFADLFRWKLLYKFGGWYADTDVVCLKPFDLKGDFIIGWEEKDKFLTNTVLKVKKGHPLAKEMVYCAEHPLAFRSYDNLDVILKKIRCRLRWWKKYYSLYWGYTAGPTGVTKTWESNKEKYKDVTIVERNVFYSVKPSEWHKIIEENALSINDLPEEAYGVHLWNNFWCSNGIDKNQVFPLNSLIGQLMKKYS